MAGTLKEQPRFEVTESLRTRFFDKTEPTANGCLLWTGAVQRSGYGAIRIGKRKVDAHQAAWRIANGGEPVPIGKLIRHTCNLRQCVNVDHLVLGTHSENMQDAVANGRNSLMPRGEETYNAVLTEDLVRQIWKLYVPYKCGTNQVAKKLGLHRSTVRGVIERRTWKHITPEPAQ